MTHPVNLIQVTRLQNVCADNTGAVGGSQFHIDVTEEDVPFTGNGRGLALLGDLELSTERSLSNGLGSDVPVIEGAGLSEVNVVFPLVQTLIGGAGLYWRSLATYPSRIGANMYELLVGLQLV